MNYKNNNNVYICTVVLAGEITPTEEITCTGFFSVQSQSRAQFKENFIFVVNLFASSIYHHIARVCCRTMYTIKADIKPDTLRNVLHYLQQFIQYSKTNDVSKRIKKTQIICSVNIHINTCICLCSFILSSTFFFFFCFLPCSL